MDSQFKQRLTGAVILVLLAVLLVPELLTGPQSRPAGPFSSATTPVDGAPLRSYDIDLSGSQSGGPSAAPAPAASATAPSPPPAGAAAPIPAAPSAASPQGPDVAAQRPTADDTRPAPQQPMRGFAVQVGSFASKASADRLAADLARRRFEAFVSPVRTADRQLFRVRVGPVADRAAAQVLVTRLQGAGQTGSIVPLP